MSEWQPISTAPKDGTRVLVYRANWEESMGIGWSDEHGDWCVGGWYTLFGPTHWQPLPPPPGEK